MRAASRRLRLRNIRARLTLRKILLTPGLVRLRLLRLPGLLGLSNALRLSGLLRLSLLTPVLSVLLLRTPRGKA